MYYNIAFCVYKKKKKVSASFVTLWDFRSSTNMLARNTLFILTASVLIPVTYEMWLLDV